MSKKQNSLSSAQLSYFCGQVALILEAGLPLYDGMETLSDVDRNSPDADLYQAASKGVTESGSLYDSLKADGRWPSYLVEMVGIGERSGNLEKVMRGLETYYAREDRIRLAVRSAISYPMVLGVMLVAIVTILLCTVLPIFRRVLDSMGVALTPSGTAMMNIGTAAGWVLLVLAGLAVLAVVLVLLLLRTGKRQAVLEFLRKWFAPLGSIAGKLSAARVSGILSMLLSSGFPMEEALEMAEKVMTDKQSADRVRQIRTGLESGKSISDAVAETEIFHELQNQMIRMGFATGHEGQVLEKISELYEEQAEDDIARLVSIIEPTLVALLAVIIGAVLLSVMMPMAGILSSL